MFLFIFENWIYLTNCLVHQKNWKLLLILIRSKKPQNTHRHIHTEIQTQLFSSMCNGMLKLKKCVFKISDSSLRKLGCC